MKENFLQTICCSSCGTILSKSYNGTKSYVKCPKCHAELYYEVHEDDSTIKITKNPKNLPQPPVTAV